MCLDIDFEAPAWVLLGVLAGLCICDVNGSPVRGRLKVSVTQHCVLGQRADKGIRILSLLFFNGPSNE